MSIDTTKVTDSVAVVLARDEIHSYIDGSDDDQFLIIPCGNDYPDGLKFTHLVTELITLKKETTDIGKAKKLVDFIQVFFEGDLRSTQSLMRQIQMIVSAKQEVLKSSRWLTAEDLFKLEGFNSNRPDSRTDKWAADGLIFTLKIGGSEFFPFYALDPSRNYLPQKTLAKILRVFDDRRDGWGLAYWFASVNGFLGGKRPQDLLLSHSEFVVAAAKDEMHGVTHG